MTELTIERVRELIQTYDDFTQAKSESGGWPNPEYADAESARVARYWLLNRYGRLPLARLVLSLDAQLQQERVKSLMYQEALEAIVSGGHMAWQLDGENSYTLEMCRIANAALQALSAPQAQAGEGK